MNTLTRVFSFTFILTMFVLLLVSHPPQAHAFNFFQTIQVCGINRQRKQSPIRHRKNTRCATDSNAINRTNTTTTNAVYVSLC